MLYAGRDATEEFKMLHEDSVVKKYAANTISKFQASLAIAAAADLPPSFQSVRSSSKSAFCQGKAVVGKPIPCLLVSRSCRLFH